MITKIFLTIGVVLYALAVPLLEVNATHVFNPAWPAHARLHEVWQLVTNSLLGLYSLWLIWRHDETVRAACIALFVTGGFLLAYLLRGLYGGSMVHTDGSEKALFGVNIGVLGFGLVILVSIIVLLRSSVGRFNAPASAGQR